MVKALVLRVAGTNCDYETAFALKEAGFKVTVLHMNSVLGKKLSLQDFSLLVLPGGFSFGDYLGSAKVFANQLKLKLKDGLVEFFEQEKLILGICNGFQALVKCGMLPAFRGLFEEQTVTLTFNESMHFQDEWVRLVVQKNSKCVFTKGIESMECPINHGEGRFVPASAEILKKLYENNQVVFKYEKNPNGSVDSIAGICDKTGRVFGLMPHPEKHLFAINHPQSTRTGKMGYGDGFAIFKNAFEYLKK
ncbi:MAG: phosphoribosylformylglycinamidine synthase I [Candidatus Diapherotrites archaeon]|nr:phosphoribosylformylglycinamidine synthase I [Candidatus Diapherotrites archaeon]